MNTAFHSLSDLHCKIIVSKNDLPFQWIYAVDDAWFHPAGWTLQIKDDKNNLQEAKPLFSSGEWGKEPFEVGAQEIKETSQAGGISSQSNPRQAARGQSVELTQAGSLDALLKVVFNPSHGDAYTARELIKFIQKQYAEDLNYGLCFCTFEYFWINTAAIDQPQNAVFFDIRHALADSNNTVNKETEQESLRNAWKAALEATDLFADGTGKPLVNFDMTRLGWYLHYALKFGKIGSKGASRCDLYDNHIQIISSAINPDIGGNSEPQSTAASGVSATFGTGRGPGVMSEYTEVQTAIWNAMESKRKEEASFADITPDRFTFSPIPKGYALETGLSIFNNSFKHAADWVKIQSLLAKDIATIYNVCPNGHIEHVTAQALNLRWERWIQPTRNDTLRPVYLKSHDFQKLDINTMLSFFKHTGIPYFPRIWTSYTGWNVTFPTNPGILFLYGLSDLVDQLQPKYRRKAPKICYGLDPQQMPTHFVIEIYLEDNGASELFENYTSGIKMGKPVNTGASQALLRVGNNRCDSVNHRPQPGDKTLGELILGHATFDNDYPEITNTGSSIFIKLPASQDANP